MDKPTLKEAYRMFYSVKGHINVTPETALDCYNGYFKRRWYNEESAMYEEGFEEEWAKRNINTVITIKAGIPLQNTKQVTQLIMLVYLI